MNRYKFIDGEWKNDFVFECVFVNGSRKKYVIHDFYKNKENNVTFNENPNAGVIDIDINCKSKCLLTCYNINNTRSEKTQDNSLYDNIITDAYKITIGKTTVGKPSVDYLITSNFRNITNNTKYDYYICDLPSSTMAIKVNNNIVKNVDEDKAQNYDKLIGIIIFFALLIIALNFISKKRWCNV